MTPSPIFSLRPRRGKQKLLILLLIFVAVSLVRLEKIIETYADGQPIAVQFGGLSPAERDKVKIVVVSPKDYTLPLNYDVEKSRWQLDYFYWARCLRFYLPHDLAQRHVPVTIEIGSSYVLKTDINSIAETWKSLPGTPGWDVWESPSSVSARRSPLPLLHSLINGPEDSLVGAFFFPSMILLCLVTPVIYLLSCFVKPRTRAVALLKICLGESTSPSPVSPPRNDSLTWFCVGIAAFTTALILLAHGSRYCFVQDDNMSQFFPTILQGCRSLESGVFPTLNPYQYLGSPTASVGVYALTYPPTYLSYAVAKYLFRDVYLTLDIFVITHLFLGYVATYVLARRITLRPSLAMCAGLSFVLSGYMVVYTRGWFYMAPVALWMPLLLICILRLKNQKPITWRWAVGTGLVIGAFFHAGNAQMWTYALLLSAAAALLLYLSGQISRTRILWTLPALLIGLAIAAPLLIVQSAEVAHIERSADYKHGLLPGIAAMLLPAPLVNAPHPGLEPGLETIWPGLYHFSPLYYCGPVFLGIGLFALASLLFLRWPRRLLGTNVWLLCGGIALWFGMGEDGGLAQLFALLPVFNKFQHNWKFLPFVALFFALGGGLIVERLLRTVKSARSAYIGELGLSVLLTSLLIYNAAVSQPVLSFGDKPYPELPAKMRSVLFDPNERQQRAMAFAPWYRLEPGFVFSLSQNFSTVYTMLVLEGYDPLVEATPLNTKIKNQIYPRSILGKPSATFNPAPPQDQVQVLRAYGVRWVIVTDGTLGSRTLTLLQAISPHLSARLHGPNIQVLELKGSDPLAFVADGSHKDLPIVYDAHGATIDVKSLGGNGERVVVSLLARERMRAFADDKPLPIHSDEWNRIVVDVPPGSQSLQILYQPDWRKGFLLGGLLILSAAGIMLRFRHIAASPRSEK